MTNKHHKDIAAIISERIQRVSRDGGYWSMLHYMALQIADVLASENPEFDRVQFLKDCDLDD